VGNIRKIRKTVVVAVLVTVALVTGATASAQPWGPRFGNVCSTPEGDYKMNQMLQINTPCVVFTPWGTFYGNTAYYQR